MGRWQPGGHRENTSIEHEIMVNFLYWSVLLLAFLGFGVGTLARTQAASTSVESPARLLNSFFETIVSARRHLVSAAVARGVSILGMYPLDTIKTRIQIVPYVEDKEEYPCEVTLCFTIKMLAA